MNSCEHSPDGYHDVSACSHCLRAALAEIERLRADAARWRCVRDTKGSDLLSALLRSAPGDECDAVVDGWIRSAAALRGEEASDGHR